MPTFRQDPKLGTMVPLMKTDDINDQAITKDKIRDGNVTTEKLAEGAVSTDKLPDGAVSTSKIASRSVTSEKIAHNSVSRAELTPDVRTSIDKKADAEQVNNSLYDLEKKIGERFVVEGDVTNLPDEEDLTSVKESERDVLKLADRTYAPEKYSGKGYKILRRNIKPVSIAVTKILIESAPSADGTLSFTINGKETQVTVSASTDNTTALVAKKVSSTLQASMTEYDVSTDALLITLTRKPGGSVIQSVFSASTTGVVCTVTDSTKREFRNILTPIMINQPNTIYEIRYGFNLNGETIYIPNEVTLKFNGGNIENGKIFSNNKNTRIENPPKMTDWLNSVYWGRFWDVNNRELTYRFDSINRPFSISLTCNREEDITTIRLKGVTETEYWIELDVTDSGFNIPMSRLNDMLLFKKKYNWSPKHIRMQNNRFKHAENSKGYVTDNVANNDSEKFIQPYYETTCTLIDWISKNFPLCEAIFLDNEDSWAYNNENWLNCYIRLAKYAETKGMLGSVVHNNFMCYENRLSIKNIGLNNRVNSDNFKIFGANIYPLTVANTRLKLSTCNLFNDSHKKVLHTFISDAVYEIMQFRGFPYLYITEGGFGQSSVGAYSNVDETYDKYGNSNYHEASKSATFEVFREWLSLLASHATFIKHYNLWGLNGPRGTSVYGRDSDLVKRDCELYYNLLLNF